MIARAEQAPVLLIPDGKSEHAPQAVDAALTPLPVGKQDDLRVGGGDKVLLAQFLSKLDVVVDLPVEDNPVPGPVRHRLIAGRQIDNAQADVRQPGGFRGMTPEPFAVGPPVLLERIHGPELPLHLRDGDL